MTGKAAQNTNSQQRIELERKTHTLDEVKEYHKSMLEIIEDSEEKDAQIARLETKLEDKHDEIEELEEEISDKNEILTEFEDSFVASAHNGHEPIILEKIEQLLTKCRNGQLTYKEIEASLDGMLSD